MAQQEKPVEEKVKDLYHLQRIDSQIDQIEVLKGELPMEVSDLEDDIVGLDTRVKRLETQVKELEHELGAQTAGVQHAESLIERYEKQMDNVKNNREYEALMKETEMQRLEIQLSQKKMIQTRRDLEAKQETLTNTRERMDVKARDLETKRVELQQIIEKTEKEEAELRRQSQEARQHIEIRLIRAYDKIRSTYRNGLAVVAVERNSCGGCFNMIPPQQQLEIAQRKKIIACEHCGRILADDTILEVGDEVPQTAGEE